MEGMWNFDGINFLKLNTWKNKKNGRNLVKYRDGRSASDIEHLCFALSEVTLATFDFMVVVLYLNYGVVN
jgi:hypothetical protein